MSPSTPRMSLAFAIESTRSHAVERLDALGDALDARQPVGRHDVVGRQHQQHELVAAEELARALVEARAPRRLRAAIGR